MPDKVYETSDIYIATILLTLGYQLDSVNKENPKRVVFNFAEEDEIEQTVKDYKDRRLRPEPMQLFTNFRYLKNRIYEEG